MRGKKIIQTLALALTIATSGSFILPSIASAKSVDKTVQETSTSTTTSKETKSTENISKPSTVTLQGYKTWLGKASLKAAAKALRAGGPIVAEVAEELGGSEATYFENNLGVIASALEKLAAEGTIIEERVVDTISSALIDAHVPQSIARTIANVFTFLVF